MLGFYVCAFVPALQMLTTDPGDTDVCYACKLLEVMILHCRQSIVDVS